MLGSILFLRSMCSSVKTYPYVLEAIDRIIDKHGVIKDNASSKLKEIRMDLAGKSIQVSKRLNAILKQAQSDGIVDSDTTVSVETEEELSRSVPTIREK